MKKLLLGLSLVLASFAVQAQCVASFIDTLSNGPGTVFYLNTSTGYTSGSTSFYWTFQGGTPSYSTTIDTVSVTYNSPGTYQTCMYLYDSLNNCSDSVCYNVSVSMGSPYVNVGGTGTPCGQCQGTVTATAGGGSAPYSYLWSNASTTASQSNLCAGTYSVTITDNNGSTATGSYQVAGTGSSNSVSLSATNTNPCFIETITVTANPTNGTAPYSYQWSNNAIGSSFNSGSADGLYTVTVTDANGCVAMDSIYITRQSDIIHNQSITAESCMNCCDGGIALNPTGGSGSGYSYQWSNNATSSSISNVCPGNYTVTVTDGNGCTRAIGYYVPAYTCKSISGNITQGENTRVYLIEENNGFLTAVDSTVTDSLGYYYFYSVCPGTYQIKGALLPSHTMYNSYLPTYYNLAALWNNANSVVMNNNHITGIDFSLIPGTNAGGPGFVGGLISQGANRGEGDPVAGAFFVLEDNEGEFVTFTTSDANGEYAFNDIALGDYMLYVDILNKTCYPLAVSLSEESDRMENGDFLVFEESIKPTTPNGISGVSATQVSIFPNPSNGVIRINGKESIDKLAVYSVNGQKLINNNPRANTTEIDISDLAQGQYILRLETNGTVEHHVIIKE